MSEETKMASGYIIWHRTDGTTHNYDSYPAMEWHDGSGWLANGWFAALLTNHPFGKALETLGGFAGFDDGNGSREDPKEFSEEFTFPLEWMEGVEDVSEHSKQRMRERGL